MGVSSNLPFPPRRVHLWKLPCTVTSELRWIQVVYREGLNIGYRYFATWRVPVAFPFGHGLSYTQFKYELLQPSADTISVGDALNLALEVENVGARAGAEIVQVS